MQIMSVRSPRWANREHTLIDCIVKFEEFKVELPFTADPNDSEAHGREIYSSCARGDYGAIEPFEPQPNADIPAPSDAPNILAAWPDIQEFLAQANTENASGTPRGIILVWSSLIENSLGKLLGAHLIDEKLSREIIWNDAHSSLGTFSGRAKICFCLGLISKEELNTCDNIRAIRNTAAHEWDLSLSNANVSKRIIPKMRSLYDSDHATLYTWQQADLHFMLRHFYATSCAILALKLAQRTIEVNRTKPFKNS